MLLMGNLKSFTDMYPQQHLMRSLNGDVKLFFAVGSVGLTSRFHLCFHFTRWVLPCGHDGNREASSCSLSPMHVFSLGVLSPPAEKGYLKGFSN